MLSAVILEILSHHLQLVSKWAPIYVNGEQINEDQISKHEYQFCAAC